MIATLKGIISEKLPDLLVIDIGGIGYGVWVCQGDWGHFNTGAEAKLYIHENIKEQNFDLFGFKDFSGKILFEQLLDVSGVGPKMALSLLSTGSIDEVKKAIAEGNTKFLQVANGIGKKVAERIVVDLKDKVGMQPSYDATTFLTNPVSNRFDEAQEALVALGFSAHDASIALSGVDTSLPTEERIKIALGARSSS